TTPSVRSARPTRPRNPGRPSPRAEPTDQRRQNPDPSQGPLNAPPCLPLRTSRRDMIFVCRQVQRHHPFEDRSFFFGCPCIRRTGPLSAIRPASCAPCLDPLPDFGDDCPPDLNGT